jgi:hypothetical protein
LVSDSSINNNQSMLRLGTQYLYSFS